MRSFGDRRGSRKRAAEGKISLRLIEFAEPMVAEAFEGGGRRHRRKADNQAMRQIEVDHVCRAIDDIEVKRQLRKVG